MPSQIRVTVAGDAAPLNVAMGSATRTLQKFGGEAEAAAKAMVSASAKQTDALKALAGQYEKLAAAAEEGSSEQVAAIRLAADAQKALAKAAIASGEEQVAAATEAAAAQKEVAAAVVATEETSRKLTGSMGVLGKAMTAAFAGFAIKEVVGGLTGAAEKFQQSMELIHTQAGATQKEVDSMSQSILRMASSVGTSPDELAAGLYHIESAGLRGSKALQALRIAAEGAKVGGADLEDVTNALNAVIVSGIKGSEDFSSAMGSLNATVGAGDMRMQDLADAMGTGLPAKAKVFGLSLKDINAALAVFGDSNIRGAEAGTLLASAIRLMGAPSKVAEKALGAIHLGATTLADDMRAGGLPKAIEDLKAHMEAMGLSASQQAQVLTRAFGGKQAGGIMILIDQLDRLKTKEKEVGDGANTFGSAWAATQKTAAFSMDRFHASMELVEITIGNKLLPLVAELANKFSDWISKASTMNAINKTIDQITGAVKAMVPYLQTAATWANTVAKALGGWSTVIKEVIITFTALKVAVAAATLVMDFNPIIAAVTALAITAGYVITHWEKVKVWFADFLDFAQKWAPVIGAVMFGPFGFVAGEVVKHWEGVKSWFEDFANDLSTMFTNPLGTLKAMFADIGEGLFGGLKQGIADFLNAVKSIQIHIKTWHGLPDGISVKWAGGGGDSSTSFSTDQPNVSGDSTITGGAGQHGAAAGTTTSASTYPKVSASGIASMAAQYGLDPQAVMAVSKMEGLGGGIGDGGHAFGPFQLNNAGGAITGMFKGWTNEQIQAWAWSPAGLQFALTRIAAVAKGQKGYAAISSIVNKFERPKNPGAEVAGAESAYGFDPNAVDTSSVDTGNPNFNLDASTSKSKKKSKPGGMSLVPEAMKKAVAAAAAKAASDIAGGLPDLAIGALNTEATDIKKEIALLKGKLHAKGTDSTKTQKAIDALTKSLNDIHSKIIEEYAADLKKETDAAKTAGQAALKAFGKGDDSAAIKALKQQAADLKKAESDLQHLIANSSGDQKKAYEAQLTRIKDQLAQVVKDESIPKMIADSIASFTSELKALTAQFTQLTKTRQAQAALQAVGYFADTAKTLQDTDTAIADTLQQKVDTLKALEAKEVAEAKATTGNAQAAWKAKAAATAKLIVKFTSDLSDAMGTVEQDLASALQGAQSTFQSAVSSLQDDLDNQLQKLAEDATGYTADSGQLAAMQAADTLQGYNDAVASATAQLQADTASGADAATLAADQKALDAANRQLQEYQLQIKAQQEQTAATQKAAQQQTQLNAKLSDYEQQLISGKITASQFNDDLASLQAEFGVTISDTVTPELVGVASAAQAVEKAFDALIAWVNKTTGSNIAPVGSGSSSSQGGYSGGSGGPGGTTEPGGGNARTPGLQMFSGGIVRALAGTVVPGVSKATDYVPAMLNGGEMIFNSGQQRNLFNLIAAGGLRFGQTQQPPMMTATGGRAPVFNFHFPNYAGDKRDLVQMLRTEFARMNLRGTPAF